MKGLLGIANDKEKKEKLKGFPEYLYTEAFLEYYEIKYSVYLNKDNRDFNYKLSKAISDVKEAIKNCENKRLSLQRRCERLLERLESI